MSWEHIYQVCHSATTSRSEGVHQEQCSFSVAGDTNVEAFLKICLEGADILAYLLNFTKLAGGLILVGFIFHFLEGICLIRTSPMPSISCLTDPGNVMSST